MKKCTISTYGYCDVRQLHKDCTAVPAVRKKHKKAASTFNRNMSFMISAMIPSNCMKIKATQAQQWGVSEDALEPADHAGAQSLQNFCNFPSSNVRADLCDHNNLAKKHWIPYNWCQGPLVQEMYCALCTLC